MCKAKFKINYIVQLLVTLCCKTNPPKNCILFYLTHVPVLVLLGLCCIDVQLYFKYIYIFLNGKYITDQPFSTADIKCKHEKLNILTITAPLHTSYSASEGGRVCSNLGVTNRR